jgi:hypothetical protein
MAREDLNRIARQSEVHNTTPEQLSRSAPGA